MSSSEDELQEQLLAFVYQTPIGICETDARGEILHLNPFCTNLVFKLIEGYDGRNIPNIFEIFGQYDPALQDTLATGVRGDGPFFLENHDLVIGRHDVRAIRIKCRKLGGNRLVFCIEDISALVELEEKRLALEKERANVSTIHALAQLAESRDDDTGSHLDRVRRYCKLLGESLLQDEEYREMIDEDFVETLWKASPLHDIGKVGIPDSILLKPGKLTPEEFEIMKTHTLIGAQTLQCVHESYPDNRFVEMGILVAAHHHERWDGSGYPYGLAGCDIPLAARIMAVADIYDALRVRRSYKEPFSHEKSRNIIVASAPAHLDPGMVRHFEMLHCQFEETYALLAGVEDDEPPQSKPSPCQDTASRSAS
jgi:HD-GYP domain-containing protein (c-di-GMP phosphodiesterase class II)